MGRPRLSFGRRLFSTLGATFAPLRTIHAVAAGRIAPALRFTLLTALPFMLLWAIVPFTHTLLFKPSFGLEVLPEQELRCRSGSTCCAPVAIGLGFSSITFVSWTLPFASLVGAFSNGSRPEAPRLRPGAPPCIATG